MGGAPVHPDPAFPTENETLTVHATNQTAYGKVSSSGTPNVSFRWQLLAPGSCNSAVLHQQKEEDEEKYSCCIRICDRLAPCDCLDTNSTLMLPQCVPTGPVQWTVTCELTYLDGTSHGQAKECLLLFLTTLICSSGGGGGGGGVDNKEH